MGWFNKSVVAPFAPRFALRREWAWRALRAFYEAAEPSHLHKNRNDRRSANTLNDRAVFPIRSQARHLDENFDIASGILDVLISHVIGTGVQPEPQVMLLDGTPAVDFNRALLKRWEQWIYACDVTRQHHYYSLQKLKARTWFRDGEVFSQKILGKVADLEHGTVLPYSIEALEPDFVPMDLSDGSRRIVQGCEVNRWGRPVAWHCYRSHPGDMIGAAGFTSLYGSTRRVPAELMMHLAFRKRLHQIRGMSIFASVMNRMDDIKETDENERIAARVASSMAAAIKKGNPDSYESSTEVGSDGRPVRRSMFFEPGIIFDELRPGESIETIDTTRPNNALIPFRDAQLRAASAGTMTSYSSSSKNYNGTWSAQRQELVEQWPIYQSLGSEFVYRDAQPTWDGFIDAVLLSGSDTVPRNVDRSTLYDATHTGPVMTWIDPEKEINSVVMQMKWGVKSRTRAIRERGDNPDQVNQEFLRDRQELERLGLSFIGDGADKADDAEDEPTDDGADQQSQRDAAETYGIAVRSGSVTPQTADEDAFRARFGYPPMSDEARERWAKEGGTRAPITLREAKDAATDEPPPAEDIPPEQRNGSGRSHRSGRTGRT